ncbi:MAG TPA: ABC transporter permease subunit, partial [Actinomycetota bacterium]
RTVIFKHGLRASLTPVVTLIGLDLGALLGGAVITETVFNLQGIGQWAVASVFQGDLPVVLAVTVVVAIAVTMMNLIVDIVYAYLDPRVRYN